MNDLPPSHVIVRFGVFELDTESAELRKRGVKIRLQEQPFQILQVLLEHPGRVVTREELQQRIWPSDTFVDFDRGLYNAIKKLREALGDSAESPRFIETFSRRGYRFIAAVEGNGHAAAVPAPTLITKPRSGWSRRLGIVLGLGAATLAGAAMGVGKLWQSLSSASTVPQIRSIAVLPLQNLSSDPNQEYFSDGMTDALITELSHIDSVRVISRTSSMQYKQTKKSLPEIARELNVDGIVEGTLQRSGDRVRITAQLVLGSADKHLWANSYERDLHDVFLLEQDVAGDIAHQVRAHLTSGNRTQLARQRPVNPAALDAYLQGNSHLHRFGRRFGDEELDLANRYFQQAIDAEPDFAPAYLGMYNAHRTLRYSNQDIDLARKSADRAMELDPNLSAAWAAEADLKMDNWDWAGAEQDYRRALERNPNDAVAHEHLSWLLDGLGRLDEGWKEAEIAQQLDPNENHLEPALDDRHEYDKIIQLMTTMLKADPDNGTLHFNLFEAYEQKGMYKEAVEQLEQTAVLYGFPKTVGKLAEAYDASGYKAAMRKLAEEFDRLQTSNQVFMPINSAHFYASAGDKERAFYWLEQAYKRRGAESMMWSLIRDPGLEPLRSDPRYKDLLRRVGLPP